MKRVSIDEVDLVDDSVIHFGGVPFTGIVYETNEAGALIDEISLKEGLRDGVTKSWYPTGERKAEISYANNSLHGEAKEWHKSGAQRQRSMHELAFLIESTTWDEAGNIVSSYQLTEDSPNYRWLKMLRCHHLGGTETP